MNYIFSYLDLWPYFLIIVVFILCFIFKPKYSSTIIFITLFLFCALRYDIGWDYTNYVSIIKNENAGAFEQNYGYFSTLFFSIGRILNFYPIVFILFAFLILKTVELTIKKHSSDSILSWLVFYSMPIFFFASLSTLRQSLATFILFYSYHFVKEKKYLLFFTAIIVASLFHTSALAGILILPIVLFPQSRLSNATFLLISFFISAFLYDFLISLNLESDAYSKLIYYINTETAKPTILQYLFYIIGISNLIFYNRLVKINPNNKALITLSTFGLIIFNILSFEPVSQSRISTFFFVFWILLIPDYCKLFTIRSARIANSIIITCFIALSFFYLSIYINAYNTGILEKISFLPYKFWFNNL